MRASITGFLLTTCFLLAAATSASSQGLRREISLSKGGSLYVINKFGRVTVRAVAGDAMPFFNATSKSAVLDPDIRSAAGSITVSPADKQKRVDIVLTIPERMSVSVETSAGEIEFSGNFASIEARSDTGTIITDVPADDLTYQFKWTESRPRYLADFEISKVKEKSAGKFEIKGRHFVEVKGQNSKDKSGRPGEEIDPTVDQKAKAVSLNFTTARGIILLNVPPNEVMSDLRERPLTEAAKAIVRSGDSLLMEAIRRASPRYFGVYAQSLRPYERQPTFAVRQQTIDNVSADVKTALVRVTDMNNRAIDGLGPSDFEVVENGVKRDILSVERSHAPFNLVLLVDVSGSIENYVDFIRKTARNFVNTVDRTDRVSIVIFNDDVKVLSTFTTDKGRLSESLDTFDAGGGTAYYDALAYVIADTLRPLRGERTAIVILTDGDDNRSFLPFDALLGSIQESGALIYPLYVPSGLIALAAQGADIDPMRQKYMALTAKSEGEGEKLAQVSGGVYYKIDEVGQLQKAYEDIVRQLRSAYSVTFRSDAQLSAASGASPHLRIKATRDNTITTITSVTASR